MNDCLIVVPAFNEEENIEKVIRTLREVSGLFDLVIVDDGSSDQTAQIARACEATVISHPTNLGYSASIQTGFKYAEKKNYPYVIFFDGDGQHDPAYITAMMEAIKRDDVDVVIGSRFLHNSHGNIGLSKRVAIQFFQHIIYWTTKKRVTDPTSGFKGYKADVYKRFTTSGEFFYDLPDSNFIIDILLRKLTILEIPVNMFDRKFGKSKIHNTGIQPVIYMAQTLLSIFIVLIKKKQYSR